MPAAGLSPLRVGPEDVTAAEAGELVKNVGVHNHAKGLIQAVARQMPRELRSAIQRFEYRERSKHLDEGEVLAQAQATVGEGVIERVLSARVKGSKVNPFDSHVIVLYETETGRTARCAIQYNPHSFSKSVKAYDRALREGKVELPGELADRADVREALDRVRADNVRLAAENEQLQAQAEETPGEDGPKGISAEDLPEGVSAGDPGWPVVNGVILDLPDEMREKLAAAEVEPQEEEVELPEGVEPGDPGYPVDAEGKLIPLPPAVRDQLIADAEAYEAAIERAREQAAEEARAQVGTTAPEPEPVDLNEVELPEGNADQIIGMVPYLYTDVLKALTLPDRESRSTVRAAAAAELAEREVELPEGAQP